MKNESVVTSPLSRRDLLRLAAFSPIGMALSAPAIAGSIAAQRRRGSPPLEANAGQWETWLVPPVRGTLPLRPPHNGSDRTRAELQELMRLQKQRTVSADALVEFWDPQGGVPAWSQIVLDTIKQQATNPVLAARALALVHTAMADAAISAWHAKFAYHRPQPQRLNAGIRSRSEVSEHLPSYASEHAAIAAAAATVLGYLYPTVTVPVHGYPMTFDAAANEAAVSRLWAGANYRSDVEAGLLLGQAVGLLAVQRGTVDGSSAVWNVNTQLGRLTGPEHWVPTPPGGVFPPLLPLAGKWNPWLLESGSQFRASTPPALQDAFPGELFLEETNEVYQAVTNLTPDQSAIAHFWADDPGLTFTPPGHWAQVAAQHTAARNWSAPRAARAMALVSVGLADAAIACWDAKYAYWVLRPITAIRTLTGQPFSDPNFSTLIDTPPFPSYTSGHSTFSGAAAAVLEHLFPNGKTQDALGQSVSFAAAADQAALSRLLAGIHYRSDNEEGLICGQKVASLVIRRAKTDRAGR